ncbi:hypothetical protein RSSM_02982 [Rhodopirellula sallentina SM41]|uniref:Uncharacterized protein n=1 Tax=Rhodopirellula sallentina SM41 TaxID=1263870 RepID=M5U2A9_9BACT|nr:hypothetical protein RSSM_02982 [Rhodopirellula sallentina SM41]
MKRSFIADKILGGAETRVDNRGLVRIEREHRESTRVEKAAEKIQ